MGRPRRHPGPLLTASLLGPTQSLFAFAGAALASEDIEVGASSGPAMSLSGRFTPLFGPTGEGEAVRNARGFGLVFCSCLGSLSGDFEGPPCDGDGLVG